MFFSGSARQLSYVFLAGAPIYFMGESEVKKSQLTTEANSTADNPFGADSVREMWNDFGASFNTFQATGKTASLAELMGMNVVAQSPGSGSAGSDGPQQQQQQQQLSDSAFGFDFAVEKPEAKKEEAADRPQPKKRTKAKVAVSGAAETAPSPAPKNPPGGGGGGDPGSDGKKRKVGRPKRDASVELMNLVKELCDSTPSDSILYGDNFKTRERNTKRVLDQADQRQRSSECSYDESRNLTVCCKKTNAILHICRYICTHGLASEGFAKQFDEQKHFLSMDPVAEIDFPSHLRQSRHDCRVRFATPGLFFGLLTPARMTQEGYEEAKVMQAIESAIEERVVSLTKSPGADVGESLRKQFPNDSQALVGIDGRIHSDVEAVAFIAWRVQKWADIDSLEAVEDFAQTLKAAVQIAEDAGGHKIVAAMRIYPQGRAEWNAANDMVEMGEDTSTRTKAIVDACPIVARAVTEAGLIQDKVAFAEHLRGFFKAVKDKHGSDDFAKVVECASSSVVEACDSALLGLITEADSVFKPLFNRDVMLSAWVRSIEEDPFVQACKGFADGHDDVIPFVGEEAKAHIATIGSFSNLLALVVQADKLAQNKTRSLQESQKFTKEVSQFAATAGKSESDVLKSGIEPRQVLCMASFVGFAGMFHQGCCCSCCCVVVVVVVFVCALSSDFVWQFGVVLLLRC